MMDVFYTLYPVNFVQEKEEKPKEWLLMEYQGVKMYVHHLKDREYQVEQILSTEPQDFIKANIAPGMIIKM